MYSIDVSTEEGERGFASWTVISYTRDFFLWELSFKVIYKRPSEFAYDQVKDANLGEFI